MPTLTKLLEIIADASEDSSRDIFVCGPCQEKFTPTIETDAETKDGTCEWLDHE